MPDPLNTASFEGVVVRKGTIAAFLANAKVCADAEASDEARRAAERDIADSLPALRVVGLFVILPCEGSAPS